MISSRLFQSAIFLRALPVLILLFLGLLWGGVPSISKYVIASGVHPLTYSFWILTIAASLVVIINFLLGRRMPPKHLIFYIFCGLTSTAIPTTVMYFAVTWIPAGLMVLLLTVAPIFTYLFGVLVHVEKYHPLKTAGLICAFIGMLLILMPGSVEQMKAPVWAILFALITPAFYAFNIVYVSLRRPKNLHSMDLAVGSLISAAIALFIVTVIFDSVYPVWDADPLIAGLILYHGALTATAFCLFYVLIKLAGALFSSQVTYSVTIFGILIGAYVHNEVLPLLVWVATVMMFIGVAFIQRARRLTAEAKSA